MATKQVWTRGDGVDFMVASSREEAIKHWEAIYGSLEAEMGKPEEFTVPDQSKPMTVTYDDAPEGEPNTETHTLAEWAEISAPGFLCSTEV